MNKLILSRILTENLILKRNPADYQSYIETFRESLIDANPHQIETVIYALEKLESGGCIFADEVGLGKTIEAGLVITQYRSNRKWNILIIVPTSLSVQWQNQLKDLFQLSSYVITSKSLRDIKKRIPKNNFTELAKKIFPEPGIYIIGRELAGRLERDKVISKKDWDLIIVDEAHEIFANIYRRFSNYDGQYNIESSVSQRAANLRYLFLQHPLLLLTATPIQNNILELWGLASYISDKNPLGHYHHFKKLFLSSETGIVEDKREELRNRIKNFLIRNLRKDAEVFMKYKFTDRICETLNFNMTENELKLYEDISNYFERDNICAYDFGGGLEIDVNKYASIRTLLKMHYRRLLGSSFAALKSGLITILNRLEEIKKGEVEENNPEKYIPEIDSEDNLEDDINSLKEVDDTEEEVEIRRQNIESEIKEIKDYIKRAEEIKESNKEKIIVKFLKDRIFSNPDKFYQKVVIFTQSLASQKYLKEIFEKNGFRDEVVLFSGNNKGGEVEKALEIWEQEVAVNYSLSERPTGNAAVRQALVYYFKTRKKIFISTEAGAKGLNLQFCNVIINYDLPWNPQRIEQRIGRCHRYGQQKEVLVVNCINADNETEKRIYEILDNKLKLFKGVMGFSNEVLGSLSNALNFEVKVNSILNKFRTPEERRIMLKKFEDEIDEETKKLIDKKLENTRNLINNLDVNVRSRLKQIADTMPKYFSQYDNDLLGLIKYYAEYKNFIVNESKQNEHIIIHIPDYNNKNFYIGKIDESLKNAEHINLKNDFVQRIINDVKDEMRNISKNIIFYYSNAKEKSEILKEYINCKGIWGFYKVKYKGLEEEERLYNVIGIEKNGDSFYFNREETDALLKIPFDRTNDIVLEKLNDKFIAENLQTYISNDSLKIQQTQQPKLEQRLHKLQIELNDTKNYLTQQEEKLEQEIQELDKKIKTVFDATEGKRLIKERTNRQHSLEKIREKLLKFQQEFSKLYNEEETKLLEKRFLDIDKNLIFQFNFVIK